MSQHFPQSNGFSHQPGGGGGGGGMFANGGVPALPSNGVAPQRRPSMTLEEAQAFQQHQQQQQQQLAYQQAQAQRAGLPPSSALVGASALPLGATPRSSLPPGAAAMHQAALLRNAVPSASRSSHPSNGNNNTSGASLAAPIDGGPPFNVPLLQMFTQTTPLGPGEPFPSIAKEDQERVKQWMARDTTYEKEVVAAKRSRKVEFHEMAEDVIRSQDWLGGDAGSRSRLKIRMESERAKERERGKRGNNRKEIKLTKHELRAVATLPEVLVPIRLEYEHEAYKLRDTFTWNLRETIVTPEIFASHLCEDLRLPFHPFYKEIVTQIKRHIEDAHLTEEYAAHLADDLADVREDNRSWFEHKAKRRKLDGRTVRDEEAMSGDSYPESEEDEEPVTLREFSQQEGRDEELRVMIKLDITLDSVQLVDKFEWDISDPHNSPEDFADIFAADLGLGGEFRTAIAHSIREQVDLFVKSLCLLGHVTGYPVPDDDLRREFLPPLFEPFRPDAADFTPLLNQLSPDEVERNDKEREREVRRKRRQTKGRGVTLPDRDAVKTHRTLVPKPSTVPLHSYQDSRGDMVYPMPDMSKPYPIALPVASKTPSTSAKPQPVEGYVVVADGPSAPTGGRLRRLRVGDSAASLAAADQSIAGTPYDSAARASTPTPADAPGPSAKPSPSAARHVKKPPIIVATAEELGLHEHIIDGQWFCANCGVPDALAVGRRKGLSGNNSLCGTCGKFFHRYRRNRPCEYTTDLSAHQKSKKASDAAAARPPAPALGVETRGADHHNTGAASTAAIVPPGDQPSMDLASRESTEESMDGNDSDSSSVVSNPVTEARRDRDNSPDLPYVDVASPDSGMSSLSSISSPVATEVVPQYTPQPAQPAPAPTPPAPSAEANRLPPIEPLPWMAVAAADLRSKQADDRFEIIPRGRPLDPSMQEWRIRCLDCPGKLYNLGPGETLDNFSVHFKNRQHRANVEARIHSGSVPE